MDGELELTNAVTADDADDISHSRSREVWEAHSIQSAFAVENLLSVICRIPHEIGTVAIIQPCCKASIRWINENAISPA